MNSFLNPLPNLKCLTEEELDNPEKVFINFFENFNLADTKKIIEDAKRMMLRKRFSFFRNSRKADDMKFFFEKLERMVEAAWMIRTSS